MVKYKMECSEYILKVLRRTHEKDPSIPFNEARWTDIKPNLYEVTLPFPLNEKQKKLLESEGVRFIFG
jgi:hypothetical protein